MYCVKKNELKNCNLFFEQIFVYSATDRNYPQTAVNTIFPMKVTILMFLVATVTGNNEISNCMYAVNSACEILASNNRECRVSCETPQQIGESFSRI